MKQFLRTLLVPSFLLVLMTANAQQNPPGNGNSSDRAFLRAKLYAQNGNIADGNMVAFDDDFCNCYDGNDAIKMMNPGENFGMRRDGRILAIEARYTLAVTDTIYYDIRNLATQTYQIKFAPQYMTTLFDGFLQDNFLNTETPVSMSDSTFFFFNVTSNPASKAFDRFRLVFRFSLRTLPVNFTSISAKLNDNKNVDVKWGSEQEVNISGYEIERSNDGVNFKTIGRTTVSAGTNSKQYAYTDNGAATGMNYYRIKALNKDNTAQYSSIAKVAVTAASAQTDISIVSLRNGMLDVRFKNVTAGKNMLQLVNTQGQVVFKTSLSVTGGSSSNMVQLPASVHAGIYFVKVTAENSAPMTTQKVLVQ